MANARKCKKCGQWFFEPPANYVPPEPHDPELCEKCNAEVTRETNWSPK